MQMTSRKNKNISIIKIQRNVIADVFFLHAKIEVINQNIRIRSIKALNILTRLIILKKKK